MAQINVYKDFTKEDFINDEYFQNWVFKSGDSKMDEFWKNVLEIYPHQRVAITEAKEILEKISFDELFDAEAPSEEKIKSSFLQVSRILGLKNNDRKTARVISNIRWWAAAASVIIIFSLGYFFIKTDQVTQIAQEASSTMSNDVAPGGNKAILTLGNGEEIILDHADDGTLLTEGGSKILKLADGQLAYEGSSKNNQKAVYNTITTPPGGQYSLTLSDGTKVWLNAASSLRYPTLFSEGARHVELSGEGYFEVATNKAKPFKVSMEKTVVEVLGTHFNINSYKDELSLKTTLLEGKVRVISGEQNTVIAPGQQAVLNYSSNALSINKSVNLDEAIAWKSGLFQFDDTDIHNVMRQIGRWYDVEVVFENKIPAKRFTGKIYRNVNVSEVFKILETLGIQFKIEGRKIIVTN